MRYSPRRYARVNFTCRDVKSRLAKDSTHYPDKVAAAWSKSRCGCVWVDDSSVMRDKMGRFQTYDSGVRDIGVDYVNKWR